MFRRRNLQYNLDDVIKFNVMGCYIYEPSEDIIHSGLDMNKTTSMSIASGETELGLILTGKGDVDSWDGWLADSEGSDY